jgi:hypothetical protein
LTIDLIYKIGAAGMGILFMVSGWLFDQTGRNGGGLFYIGLSAVIIGFILVFFHSNETE